MVCEFMCSGMQHCAVGCVALGTGKNCTTVLGRVRNHSPNDSVTSQKP